MPRSLYALAFPQNLYFEEVPNLQKVVGIYHETSNCLISYNWFPKISFLLSPFPPIYIIYQHTSLQNEGILLIVIKIQSSHRGNRTLKQFHDLLYCHYSNFSNNNPLPFPLPSLLPYLPPSLFFSFFPSFLPSRI